MPLRDRWIAGIAALRIGAWLARGAPASAGFSQALLLVMVLTFVLVSAVLYWGSRQDERARPLAVVYLLTASVYTSWGPRGPVPDLAALPLALRVLQPAAFLPYFLWLFFSAFPRVDTLPAERRRTDRIRRGTYALGVVLFVVNLVPLHVLESLAAGIAADAAGWLNSRDPSRGFWTVVGVTGLPALGMGILRARRATPDERRRVRLLLLGLAVGGGLPLLYAAVLGVLPQGPLEQGPGPRPGVVAFEYGGLLFQAIVTVYAVISRRALDIRLLVRRTLQYALARNALLVLVVAPFLLLLVVAYGNRDLTITELLQGNTLGLVVALTTIGVVFLRVREPARAAIDRRFFREAYDARHTLSELVDRSRKADDPDSLARLLCDQVDRALHVERIGVLFADPDHEKLVSPAGECRSLALDTPLARWASSADGSLDIVWDREETPLDALAEPDREWLADAGFSLLVPFRDSRQRLLGLLGLGEKKSQLPFSAEDRELLEAVAGSAGLALENRLLRQAGGVGDRGPRDVGATGGAPPATRAAGRTTADAEVAVCDDCGAFRPAGAVPCTGCGTRSTPRIYPRNLAGKFRLLEQIGRGGMGVVFRAKDVELGRDVAVKTLPRLEPVRIERLRREARAMAAVSHPNLAVILALETWRGTPFLILEYMTGGTLSERLEQGPIEVREALEIGATLAGAVERLHEARILHRDIKPSNIGFTGAGETKLLDFGLAKLLRLPTSGSVDPLVAAGEMEAGGAATLTEERQIVGTLAYLSPEALEGREPGPGLDLWSLHVVVYEMIAGETPFPSAFPAILVDIVERGAPDLRELGQPVSAETAAYFRRALAPNEKRRPSTAREVRESLRGLARASD